MFDARGLEITQKLRDVFVRQSSDRLDFDQETLIHQQVGKVVSKVRAIFIEDLDRKLPCDDDSLLLQSRGEGILVDLFQVAVAMEQMDRIRRLPDLVAEFKD